LRTATLAVLLLAFVALAVGQWASARWFYDSSFDATERADALGRARHTEASLRERVDFLRRNAADNGAWDDAYAFMLGRNRNHPQHQFGATSFDQLHILGFAFLSMNGRLVDAQQFDPEREQYALAGADLRQALTRQGVIGAQVQPASNSGGFARFGGRLYAWGAAPITPTDGQGKPVGSLVLVSELDEAFVRFISQTVNSNVALLVRPMPTAGLPPSHAPLDATDVQFSAPDDTQLDVQFCMGAVDETNALDVTVRSPRVVHATALRASRYFLWSTLAFGTLLGALAFWFVEWRLLRPVQAASEALVAIGRSGDLSARLALPRHRDQIGALVGAVNQTLAQLESKQAAEAARERAEAANRAKSDFLATMSHEIRTPLNGVLGMTELLLESGLAVQQHEWAKAALASGRHLLHVINDILDFSKIESGHMTLESIDFDLMEIVEEALVMFAQPSAKKGLELVLDVVPSDLQLALRGDPFRLRQVIVNLISNAIKFTDQGEVLVRVEVDAQSDTTASIRLSVKDTGIGIAADAQARIFEVFSQADGTTTRQYGGTGLGLSICRRLLSAMGGSIRVHSAPGQGATFLVALRLPKAAVAPIRQIPLAALEGVRVLVVDDNPSSRQSLLHQLAGWHMRVALAQNAAQAQALLADAASAGAPFELALLDLDMPQIDGLDLARQIRAQPRLAGPRLILLASALADINPARRQGAAIQRVISKPVRRVELFRAIIETLTAIDAEPELRPPAASPTPTTLRGQVLLVEDNPVNQAVAAAMLVKLGVSYVVANNGQEAVELVGARRFDLVLMDCQMPVMDGFAATAAIRQLAQRGPQRLPILALTANAVAGDEQKCLDAGMDGFLAKPFSLRQLQAHLDSWLGDLDAVVAPAGVGADPKEGAASGETTPINRRVLEAMAELDPRGGTALMKTVLQAFLESAPQSVVQIEHGLEAGDSTVLCRGAHTLKSSCANVGAEKLSQLYRQLENLGRENRIEEGRALLPKVRQEHDRSIATIRRILQEVG
jgi:signal transduction histidine kinase/CheY-like chemotaxis protein/HPt (histidine-containing phosphotransfer) domain-containing protein